MSPEPPAAPEFPGSPGTAAGSSGQPRQWWRAIAVEGGNGHPLIPACNAPRASVVCRFFPRRVSGQPRVELLLSLCGSSPCSVCARAKTLRSLLYPRLNLLLIRMPKRGKKDDIKCETESAVQDEEPENKKGKKGGKEAEPVIQYEDAPDKLTTEDGKKSTLKISSWNVDGIRAWVKKAGLTWVREEDPDILCLQETKCAEKALPADIKEMPEYPHKYWACSDEKEGYSGVAMLCKEKPLDVSYGIGIEEHDKEGRVITAEFDSFYLVAAYVPNSSRGLVRLDYRQRWDVDFRAYLKGLDSKKPHSSCVVT
ncbi:unnamed protein product [Ranitomeya imitator]|uniref:exodeoxyribonuclease III n=1 Tax=Ranitomeya imitator TaxID=111125 RepID=A0ABN9M2Y5_9NEOB|nr:unnamed protein product [Ranitomeya imitator]